jgi:hypothetical protein
MEEDIAKASPKVMEAELGPVSTSLTPSAAREAVPTKVPRQEGSTAPGADGESSLVLISVGGESQA